ncbi:MAG: hypothetical protein R3C49_21605 [Planctomycetaceae bacterium]
MKVAPQPMEDRAIYMGRIEFALSQSYGWAATMGCAEATITN